MKKFLLLFASMFFMLGTSVAQDKGDGKDEGNAAFGLEYTSPANGEYLFTVDNIRLQFNKDVVATLPEGGIDVKNNTTGEVVKITRLDNNEWLEKSTVVFLFEQKIVYDEKEGKEQLQNQYISTPGEWSYTVPAGCIKSVDGEEFAEQTFTFNIATPMEIENITPASEVTELDKIEITFPRPIAKVATNKLSLLDNYWQPASSFKSEVTYSDDRKTVTLELETPITTPGTYNLDIYQGVFQSEDGALNSYKSVSFYVIDPTPSFSTNFNEGDKVKEIGNLEITFKNVNEVKLVEGADPVVVYTPAENELEGTATLADKKITVTFGQKFTEEGVYTFVVPAGMFTMDGVKNQAYSVSVELYTFTITPLEIVKVTPEMGTVSQIDKIIVEFNQKVSLSYNEDWQQISREITLKGETKEYVLTYAPSSYNASNIVEYLVNAVWNGYDAYESTPLTEAGTYTLDLKEIVVDYAGEDYIDNWGYTNTNWHGKKGSCEGIYTWTIATDGGEEPVVDIDMTKVYRVLSTSQNKYLNIEEYNKVNTGAKGSVGLAELVTDSKDQTFMFEDAGNGKFYLVSTGGYYLVCRQWNIDACNNEKSPLGIEFTEDNKFYIKNGSQYFKVGPVSGDETSIYPYCDAPSNMAETWSLVEATDYTGIDEVNDENVVKTIYDLTGRKIEKISNAGIYIVNGKKIIVK